MENIVIDLKIKNKELEKEIIILQTKLALLYEKQSCNFKTITELKKKCNDITINNIKNDFKLN